MGSEKNGAHENSHIHMGINASLDSGQCESDHTVTNPVIRIDC